MNLLEIDQLKKNYGSVEAVKQVSFSIAPGEIFGFIGPNGAGKSTTIRCIMNQINKSSGSIQFHDKELLKNDHKAYEKIGYLPSEISLYPDLTVGEMLKYNASFYKKDTLTKANELCQKLQLDLSKKMDQLSLGNGKKVGIVLALMHDPELVVMDEATSGLDPLIQEAVYQIILEEKKKGTTFLFSSHNLPEVKKICDRIGIIKNGVLIRNASVEELTATSVLKVHFRTSDPVPDSLKAEKDGDHYTLLYQNDVNSLLSILSGFHLEKLLIEEPDLEEIFMHYYE